MRRLPVWDYEGCEQCHWSRVSRQVLPTFVSYYLTFVNSCTALDGTAKTGVTCIRGECHAWLCKRGYKLVDGVCVPK